MAAEQVADAGRGDPIAELEQLAADAFVTPERVLPGQLQHQLPALGWELRSAGTAATAKRCPATMDQRPVPAENCGRLNHEQGTGRQLAAEGSQDQAIGHPPARAPSSASEDEQLLAEDEEFEIAIGSRAATEDEEIDQQAKEGIEKGGERTYLRCKQRHRKRTTQATRHVQSRLRSWRLRNRW